MLVVDSSVLVAIALIEAQSQQFRTALSQSAAIYVGWPTLVEIWTVIAGRSSPPKADAFLDGLLDSETLLPVAFQRDHYRFARQAYERFRLAGHPAKLNYGDVMSYALARAMDVPLLFKGTDFGLTDVRVHPASVLA
jgi:ribonuclease VapC